jgi:hypothetical protein
MSFLGMKFPSDKPEPVAYTAESVLTIQQVAEWLQISTRMVERIGLKAVYLGPRTRRYRGATVLEYLAKKEAA